MSKSTFRRNSDGKIIRRDPNGYEYVAYSLQDMTNPSVSPDASCHFCWENVQHTLAYHNYLIK